MGYGFFFRPFASVGLLPAGHSGAGHLLCTIAVLLYMKPQLFSSATTGCSLSFASLSAVSTDLQLRDGKLFAALGESDLHDARAQHGLPHKPPPLVLVLVVAPAILGSADKTTTKAVQSTLIYALPKGRAAHTAHTSHTSHTSASGLSLETRGHTRRPAESESAAGVTVTARNLETATNSVRLQIKNSDRYREIVGIDESRRQSVNFALGNEIDKDQTRTAQPLEQ